MPTEVFVDTRDDYEIIGGEKFMAPSPGWGHVNVAINLATIINAYVRTNKLGVAASDNFDVHFPDGSLFKPDFMFLGPENANRLFADKSATLHGVPEMVAEIFSRSTMKRDIGIKKNTYERNGVKEYWLINPWSESISVYLLRDGKYFLDEIYHNYSESELSEMTDEERAEVKLEVPVAVLDGFTVKIRNIFGCYFE